MARTQEQPDRQTSEDPSADEARQDRPKDRQERQDGQDRQDGQRGRAHAGRLLAEWVSLGVSLVVLLGAGGFLIYEGLQQADQALPITATVKSDQATLREGRHVVPIEVRNDGSRTARDLTVKIAHRSHDGQWQDQEFEIDYLAEYSSQTIYVYLDRPPKEAELFAEPQQYRLE